MIINIFLDNILSFKLNQNLISTVNFITNFKDSMPKQLNYIAQHLDLLINKNLILTLIF